MDAMTVSSWIAGGYTGVFALIGYALGRHFGMLALALIGWNVAWIATRQIRFEEYLQSEGWA